MGFLKGMIQNVAFKRSLWQKTWTIPLDLSGMQHPRAMAVVEHLSRDECVSIFPFVFSPVFSFALLLQPPGALSSAPWKHNTLLSLSLSLWLTDCDLRLLSAQLYCNICKSPPTPISTLLPYMPSTPHRWCTWFSPATTWITVIPLCFTRAVQRRKHKVTNPHCCWWDAG